jgi:hypothetical protein
MLGLIRKNSKSRKGRLTGPRLTPPITILAPWVGFAQEYALIPTRADSAALRGLGCFDIEPTVETVGYCRMSLRDSGRPRRPKGESKVLPKILTLDLGAIALIPTGGSPVGTGQWPVLPFAGKKKPPLRAACEMKQ